MNYKLNELIDSDKFQKFLNSLTEEFAFAVSIIDNEGTVLAASGWTKFCTKYHHSNSESYSKCRTNYLKTIESTSNVIEHNIRLCPHGLTEFSVPVIIENTIMGSVFIGQIFTEKPDLKKFELQAKKYFFDETAYIDAVQSIPVISETSLKNRLAFIKELGEVIAESGLKRLKEIQLAENLKQNEEKFRSTFKNNPCPMALSELETGRYYEINKSFTSLLGYEEKEVIGKSPSEINLFPSSFKREEYINILTEKGFIKDFEINAICKNGDIRTGIFSGDIIELNGNKFLLSTMVDITERKMMETALKESEEKYRKIFNDATEGIYQSTPEGRYINVNPAFAKMLGYDSPQEIINSVKNIGEQLYADPGQRRILVDILEKEGIVTNFEIDGFKKDGSTLVITINCHAVYDEYGKIIMLEGTCEDITEKKLHEKKLKTEAAKWNTTFDSITDSICLLDLEGNVMQCNKAMKDILKMNDDEILNHKCYKLIHKIDKRQDDCPFEVMLLTNKPERSELKIGDRCFVISADPVFNDKGDLVAAVHTLRNITHEKTIEKTLIESEEKFRLMFENNPTCVVLVNIEFKFIKVNDKFCELTGYNEEELLSMTFKDITHPEHLSQDIQSLQALMKGEIPVYNTEKRYIHKKGEVVWGSVSVSFFRTELFENSYFIVNIENITIKKQLSEIIRVSEEKFSAAFKHNPFFMTISSLEDGKFIDVNNAFLSRSGYSRNDVIGKTAIDLELWLDNEELNMYRQEVTVKGNSQARETILKLKSGEEITCLVSGELIEIAGQKCILSVAEDISYRKKAEAKIRHLSSFPELNPLPVVEIGLDKSILFYNEAVIKALNDAETEDIKVFFPHNIDKIISLATMYINEPFVSEINVGGRIYSQSIHYTDEFKSLRLYHIDITTRKIIEEALNKSEEFLNNVIENIPDMVFVKDAKELRFIRLNKAGEEILGYKQEELLGKNDYDFFPENEADFFTEKDKEVLASQIPIVIPEETIQTKNKGVRILRTKKIPIIDSNGESIYLLGISEDITEIKIARDSLIENETKFRAIFENSRDAIGVTKGFSHVFVNPAYKKIFGLAKDVDLTGISILDFIAPDKRTEMLDITNLRNSGINAPNDYETSGLRADGTKFFMDVHVSEFKINNELFTLVIIRDITGQKIAIEALRESERMMSTLISNLPGVVYRCKNDSNWTMEYISEGISILTGYSPEEFVDTRTITYDNVIHPDDRAMVSEVIRTSIINEKPFQLIYRVISKDNIQKWVWEQGKAVYDKDSNFTKLEGFITDITESKNNETELENYRNHLEELVSTRTEELEKAKILAEASTKAKSEFLANMSHEIRTPMNSIIGFSDILYSSIKDEKQLSQVNSIRSSAKSLLGIINDILDLSKVEAGKLKLEYEPVNIRGVTKDIEKVFMQKVKEKGLDIHFIFGKQLPDYVMIDEVRFRQILFNIVGNAVKFTDSGYIKVKILSHNNKLNPKYADITIIVEDTGMGIPEEQQEMIFEAFNQQQGQSTKKFGGTGLGLTITKRFIEMMNGTISLKSEINKGSIFTIQIPDIEISDENDEQKTEMPYMQGSVIFEEAKILICDDNESNRKLIIDLLSDSPLKIFEAENGKEAIEKAMALKPELIFMDLKMPVMDGYDATKIIKANESTAKIPVIVLSASTRLLKLEQGDDTIFDESLMKPISIAELVRKMKLFLKYNESIIEESSTDNISVSDDIITDADIIDSLPELIKIIDNKLMPLYAIVAKEQIIDKTIDFGKEIKAVGNNFRIGILVNFGNNIITYAENFEIDKLVKQLKDFPDIVKKIKLLAK